ncbi:MAG: shikimate dehydrogenase [Polyangiaceae bacterium]|nr:shikimate dehydrogenase [Polyangiaceae bacterium]MCW5792655.1 shikimate dehydrogenase [Polyangiaceae bacterium]
MHFQLLGHPLAHSLSPAIHQAAYAALGLEHRYSLRPCPTPADVEDAVRALRAGEVHGLNVTLPHKALALALADRADARAARTRVANVLTCKHGVTIAHNTDVTALTLELAEARRGTALVLGAGGAALAATAALSELGFARVVVSARRFIGPRPWPGEVQLTALGADLAPWDGLGAAAGAELVVQATSAGMRGGPDGEAIGRQVPWGDLAPRALAYDVVYNPRVTPFLREAEDRGLKARGGLGMLVEQAAQALELWLGVTAPRAVMRERAEQALGDASGPE